MQERQNPNDPYSYRNRRNQSENWTGCLHFVQLLTVPGVQTNAFSAFLKISSLLYVHRNCRLIRDGEPRTATSTFTQLLSSVSQPFKTNCTLHQSGSHSCLFIHTSASVNLFLLFFFFALTHAVHLFAVPSPLLSPAHQQHRYTTHCLHT